MSAAAESCFAFDHNSVCRPRSCTTVFDFFWVFLFVFSSSRNATKPTAKMLLMICQGAEEWAKSMGFTPHYYRAWEQRSGVIFWHFHLGQMEFPVPKNCWHVARLVLSGCHYRHYHLHLLASLASDHFLPLSLSISISFVCSSLDWIPVDLLFVCLLRS